MGTGLITTGAPQRDHGPVPENGGGLQCDQPVAGNGCRDRADSCWRCAIVSVWLARFHFGWFWRRWVIGIDVSPLTGIYGRV